jgi:hypothetical protein
VAALTYARPLEPGDGKRLAFIDQSYALEHNLEPLLTRASLSFFVRSGHAFVAEREGEAVGFALAQAVFNGNRPTVQLARLAVADPGDLAAYEALLEAVTKSAYDAAVYDLWALVPAGDETACKALYAKAYAPLELSIYARTLGSRGKRGE